MVQLRLAAAAGKSMTPYSDIVDASGEVDWPTPMTAEDDIDAEGTWYEKPIQPTYEYLTPTKRFAPNTKSFKALGPVPPSGHRSFYFQ